jgi:hypothetical protein
MALYTETCTHGIGVLYGFVHRNLYAWYWSFVWFLYTEICTHGIGVLYGSVHGNCTHVLEVWYSFVHRSTHALGQRKCGGGVLCTQK